MDSACEKFIFFIEKFSELHRSLLWEKSKKCNLSPIQIQILIYLKMNQKDLRNTTTIANSFNLTPATISESIKNLMEKGLVQSKKCEDDKRKHCFSITPKGRKQLNQICDWCDPIENLFNALPEDLKQQFLINCDEVVYQASKNNLFQRMNFCYDCKYYVKEPNEVHYCAHFNEEMPREKLVWNCPAFKLKEIKKV